MIKKISKIKDMGVFSDFNWPTGLPEFNRYNLFYGMNGSGKTTLSSLFSVLSDGACEPYPELSYSIDTATGTFDRSHPYPQKVRVFNSEYVRLNIGDIEGQLKPILIVGKENKTLFEKLKDDQSTLDRKKAEEIKLNEKKEKVEKNIGKRFTEIAKLISADTSGQVTRTYRKPDAEKDYRALGLFVVLSEEDIEQHKQTLRQEVLDEINFSIPLLQIEDKQDISIPSAGAAIADQSKVLLAKTAASVAVGRLQENIDIQSWVETGVHLHKKHNTTICEYCCQPIPAKRIAELAQHFNEADQSLRQEIETETATINLVYDKLKSFTLPTKTSLYGEFRDEFATLEAACVLVQKSILGQLTAYAALLNDKQGKRTEAVSCDLEFDAGSFSDTLESIKALIEKHNEKSRNFSARQQSAKKALETHHLSSIGPDIKAFDDELKKITNAINLIINGNSELTDPRGLSAISEDIKKMKAQVSSAHKAAEELTDNLHIFLGRKELEFVSENEGYTIKRHGKPAKRLSEGEKTAIAFVYFTIHLKDQDFSLKDGIVVIDDPISSLDTNSIYQAFAFLKTAVSEAKQVFIFTHNYEFLKLLLNWMKSIKKAEGKKSYYMLSATNGLSATDTRKTTVCLLDKELLAHESEYNFLFKTLCQYKSDGTIASSYHIPNVARKVLETFADFYCPCEGSLYEKVKAIDYNPVKKTALLKFANDLSHPSTKWFDPALIPETQNNVHHLLEMIEELLPDHHKALMQAVSGVDIEEDAA